MPNLDEMTHGEHRPVAVIDLQAEYTGRPQPPTGHHDRYFFRVTPQFRVAETTGEDDDAVDAAGYEFPHAALFVLFTPIAAHEKRYIAVVPQTGLDAPQSFTIERTVDRLRHHTDGRGLAEGK